MKIGIIGGGIAGLFCAYRLCKDERNIVYLYEKELCMGGRIFTLKIADYLVRKFDEVYIRDDITNREKGILSKINYEVGAGRFSLRHKNLIALFNELDISREKMIPIGSDFTYRTEDGVVDGAQERFDSLINTIYKNGKGIKNLDNLSVYSFISNFLSDDDIMFLKYFDCYSNERFNINIYDFLDIIENEHIGNPQFYVLAGGLSQLINKLIVNLRSMTNCKFFNDHNIVSITENNSKFIFNLNEKHQFDKIIVTSDPGNLKKIKYFRSLIPYLNPIKDHSLTRIYIVMRDTPDARYIEKQIDRRFTTNNILRYVIPIDKKKLLYMIYVEGEYVDLWENKYKNGILDKSIEDQFYKLFNKKIEIIYRGYHCWNAGVHYREKRMNIDGFVKPYKKKELYLCNSAYDCFGWIDCSLNMANKVLKKIK